MLSTLSKSYFLSRPALLPMYVTFSVGSRLTSLSAGFCPPSTESNPRKLQIYVVVQEVLPDSRRELASSCLVSCMRYSGGGGGAAISRFVGLVEFLVVCRVHVPATGLHPFTRFYTIVYVILRRASVKNPSEPIGKFIPP